MVASPNGSVSGQTLYRPLKEGDIRVLCLEPGVSGAPLRCALEHVSLQLVAQRKQSPPSGESGSEGRALRSHGRSAALFTPDVYRTSNITSYEAISYTWGEPIFSRQLVVDSTHKLGITESLYLALQQFRLPHEVRVLWADAVCINQGDNAEKSEQVNGMAEIYSTAYAILVWLGTSDDSDALAFATIHALAAVEEELVDYRDHFSFESRADIWRVDARLRGSFACDCCGEGFAPDEIFALACDKVYALAIQECSAFTLDESSALTLDETFKTALRGHELLVPNQPEIIRCSIAAVLDLFRSPWFTRLWVIQEAAVNNQVSEYNEGLWYYKGSHRASAQQFLSTLAAIRRSMVDNPFRTQHAYRDYVEEWLRVIYPDDFVDQENFPMSSAFWLTYAALIRRRCGDPRDRVYAIRSYMELDHFDELTPDYNISVSEL